MVAMGLGATLAQSDISTKLTIAAKAFSGSVRSDNFAFTMTLKMIETHEHAGDFKQW